jgi:hypothetical protein
VVWTSILNWNKNPEVGPVVEIPCPDGYEYELDSDFDEDEAVEPAAGKPSLRTSGLHALTLGSRLGEESDSKRDGGQ